MARDTISDLSTFLMIAREKSFTKAAAKLSLSPSALSHTIRLLEERLGVRLLTRTTRSVSLTDAGERLLKTVQPQFEAIELALSALTELRDKPAGTVRITAGEHAAEQVLWPAIERLLPVYPDIKVEIVVDNGLTDIVAERYDAGVRLGEQVDKDMIAVRIGPEMRMAVVGAPDYFTRYRRPVAPQDLTDLWRVLCLGVREGGPRSEGSCRWTACLQQFAHDAQCGPQRRRPCHRARRSRAPGHCRRAADPRAGRLVPAVFRLPPLLSQPPPDVSGLRGGGGRAETQRYDQATAGRLIDRICVVW